MARSTSSSSSTKRGRTTRPRKSAFGNIRQLPSGRYQARYDDPAAGTVTAPTTFETWDAADLWLASQRVDRAAGTWVDPTAGRLPLRSYVETWQAGLVGRRASTAARDAGYVERYVVAELGDRELGAITAADVRLWVRRLTDRGLAPSTVGKAGQLLGAVFDQAVADRLVPANPTATVRWPKVERHELDVLTPAEIDALADSIDERYRAVVLLGCWAGLRIGEIVGLRVGDVDVLRRTVTVNRTVVEVSGELHVHAPKTRAGRRAVPLPASIADELGVLLDGRHRDDLVVEAPKGGYVRLASWRTRYWRDAVEAIGRPAFRIHDMRHTAVSLWISTGADAKKVAAWAGHASVVSVFDRYGHLFDAGADETMTALDAMRSAAPAGKVVALRR